MTAKMATREAYGKALVEIGAENPNLIVMLTFPSPQRQATS